MVVRPFIENYSDSDSIYLERITVVTVENKSVGYNWKLSMGGGNHILAPGESMMLEAGANAVFDSIARMDFEPIAPQEIAEGDYANFSLTYNKVVDATPLQKIFENLV